MFRLLIFSLIAAAISASASAQAPEASIGILEERPPSNTAETSRFVVRAVFHREGAGWTAFDDSSLLTAAYPRSIDWTVGFSGRSVGKVKGETPRAGWSFYADVGTQVIAQTPPPPSVGSRSMEFAGWMDMPVYRPLVASSTGRVGDPEMWTRATPGPKVLDELRRTFRAAFPVAERCTNVDDTEPDRWVYSVNDLVVDRTYASSTGWRIARVSLPIDAYGCDGPVPEEDAGTGASPWAARTYVVSPTGKVADLGRSLLLVDAGDYDGDGQSELIFQLSGYNLGGYVLWTSSFAKSATFNFHFH